jgi:energy-coupling factor transporter ATP-binding protein EcfA2
MHMMSFVLENFKKIRVVEVALKGRVTTITGRNGQGKTSVLDALWALFAGKKGIPEKPVRKGAEKSKLTAVLSDDEGKPFLVAKRMISGDRTTTLTIEAAPGAERPAGTPQAVMDALIGEMTFDPVAFSRLDAKKQAEILRSMVKLDVDLDDLANANRLDYAERTIVNRKVAELRAQAAAMVVSPGLPKERVDEEAIKARKAEANEANKQVVVRIEEKLRLAGVLQDAEMGADRHMQLIADKDALIERLHQEEADAEPYLRWANLVEDTLDRHLFGNSLPVIGTSGSIWGIWNRLDDARMQAAQYIEQQRLRNVAREAEIDQARLVLTAARNTTREVQEYVAEARMAWEQAPDGQMVDVTALDEELERAQLTNREIAKRERRDEIEGQVQEQERKAAQYTRAMEGRDEKKTASLAGARMPLDGLALVEEKGEYFVAFKGIPLEQLGHAEKIRVGCALAIAAVEDGQRKDKVGKLRCIPIDDAECLDDDSLAIMAEMAEEHDFQLILFKVDTSGKVGIVLEDGLVAAVNE